MIDVIFLLLIFFVSTASFRAAEETLPTNLSLPGTLADSEPIDPELEDLDDVVIKILWAEGRTSWQINGEDLPNLSEVRAKLEAVARVKIDLPVILDVEGAVPMEDVIDVYDICRQIGLQRIQFAASLAP